MKKVFNLLLLLFLTLLISFVLYNTKFSVHKDAVYKKYKNDTMKFVKLENKAGKNYYQNVSIEKKPYIEPKENEVVVKVFYASLTQFDLQKHREKDSSFIPCSDFSGIVVQVGQNVSNYEVGDKVFGAVDTHSHDGACADYIVVEQNNINFKPFSLTMKQASIIPTTGIYINEILNLIESNNIEEPNIIIDNAISEIGTTLMSLLNHNNFKNVTAIDDKNIEAFLSMYGVRNFISNEQIATKHEKALSKYNKFDIAIDLQDGLDIQNLAKFVKDNGFILTTNNNIQPKLNIENKNINIIKISPKIQKENFGKIARLIHLGKLPIAEEKEYFLDQFREAIVRINKGNLNGRVAIKVFYEK